MLTKPEATNEMFLDSGIYLRLRDGSALGGFIAQLNILLNHPAERQEQTRVVGRRICATWNQCLAYSAEEIQQLESERKAGLVPDLKTRIESIETPSRKLLPELVRLHAFDASLGSEHDEGTCEFCEQIALLKVGLGIVETEEIQEPEALTA